jgi:AcrR family transcriptional regulator
VKGSSQGRRARKKQALRAAISDVATRLFIERGFEAVTLGEVAEAADVAVKTILNHFGSKEELFFDREAELVHELVRTVRQRPVGEPVVVAFRRYGHALLGGMTGPERDLAWMVGFWRTIEQSPSLRRWELDLARRQAEAVIAALADECGHERADVALQVLVGSCLSVVRCMLADMRARLLAGEAPATMREHLHRELDRGFDLLERGLGSLARRQP